MTALDAPFPKRDYSLTGPDGQRAVEIGLASADWYHSEVSRKVMKDLMRRTDGPALRDTALWIGLMLVSGAAGVLLWGTWWAVPAFFVYGVLYGSGADARWHEHGHGTAFRTDWMNNVVYHLGAFMLMRNPIAWRWSHARHHTDTIVVGRDPEIAVTRPPSIPLTVLRFVNLPVGLQFFWRLAVQATGKVSEEEKLYVPEAEWPKVVIWARIHMAIYAATLLTALAMQSVLPLMLIGLPTFYGAWHMVLTGLLQHGGLAEDVIDHRLNSRTVLMNPVSRFIYLNMNYHVEHHMFPMVPYHALPQLHALIRDDLPPANPSIWHAYREMIPALLRQRRDPTYYLRRELPPRAKPYRDEFHAIEVRSA
jgi:fatty acid desaturase